MRGQPGFAIVPRTDSARRPVDWSACGRIAVFRALQLGDMLCAVPALRALRTAAPQAHITLIGLPWADSFVRRFARYVDELLPYPGFPGMPERQPDLAAMPAFLAAAQERNFDLAIQLHGSGVLSNPAMMMLGAKRHAGFYQPGQFCPDPHSFMPWPEQEHEIWRYLRLMEFLGVPLQGDAMEFPLSDEDHRDLQASQPDLPAPGSYVCIHPGARLSSRRWMPQRFAEVADALAADGMRIVVTGSEDERAITQAVLHSMRSPALDLTGKTSLGALAALVAQARLVVCNDTGISHIAAAVATPSVIVSCGSDTRRWAPLDRQRHRVISSMVSCRPCMHTACPVGHDCAHNIAAPMVTAAARNILSNNNQGLRS